MSQKCCETGFKCGEKNPTNANLYDHWHKEKSWTILKAKNIDNSFGNKDNSKHEDSEKAVHGEHWPQRLPGPVVIGQDSLQHGAEGEGHRDDNEYLKVHSKAVKVVLLDQPVKSYQKNPLYDELAEGLCDSL